MTHESDSSKSTESRSSAPATGIRVVFLSHSAPSPIFKVGSHHLSREFAALGASVAHVAAPVSLPHLARIRDAQVRRRLGAGFRGGKRDTDGVEQFVPFTPLPLSRLDARARARALALPGPWRSSLLKSWSDPDVVFVDQPLLGPLADELRPRLVVYRPTDAHYDANTRDAELSLLRRADGLVATSARVRDEVLDGMDLAIPAMVLENGVEYDRFTASAERPDREGFVYVGAVDRRFEWAWVDQLARAFPEQLVRIAGPVTAPPSMSLPENVLVLGPVPYAQVPELLAGAKIGILPYSSDPGNAGRSPMKYYEYLAAGLSVVARDSPALRQRGAPGAFLFTTIDEAVTASAEALTRPVNDAGREFASAFSWRARAQELLGFAKGLA